MIIGDEKVCDEIISLHNKLKMEMEKEQWNSITLCSAFLTESAANSIIELIDKINTQKKIKINIIVGIKSHFTKPEAIRIILEYINSNNRSNFQFNFRLPREVDFHIKCYIFLGENEGKALVGSANLTNTGLESIGELMVEVDDEKTINTIVSYVDYYLNDSENWSEYVDKYEEVYEISKPKIINSKTIKLFKKPKLYKTKEKLTIRFVSPTMDGLGKTSNDQVERVSKIFDSVKKQFPNINKSYWIIYSNQTEDEIDFIKEKYPHDSCFDRPRDNNCTWEIGTNRMICSVGAITNTLDDEVVMFMKKGCIHYKVTDEIIQVAERLGIKSGDEDYTPTEKEMDEYKQFILHKRK